MFNFKISDDEYWLWFVAFILLFFWKEIERNQKKNIISVLKLKVTQKTLT